MDRLPRRPDEPLLSRFVVVRTVWVGALMAAVAIALFLFSRGEDGADVAQAQTVAVTSIAFFQIFYLLMCRTLAAPLRTIGWATNRWIFAGIAVLLVLQAAVVHLPFMQVGVLPAVRGRSAASAARVRKGVGGPGRRTGMGAQPGADGRMSIRTDP